MIDVFGRKGVKWYKATMAPDFTLSNIKMIKGNLKDHTEGFITLKAFLRVNKDFGATEAEILAAAGVEKLYFPEVYDVDLTFIADKHEEALFYKKYWKKTNYRCNNCTKTCKQSDQVRILVCPDFVRKPKAA
jgi:hypothetical protein